jgi:predicted TIM-barrel fold metal-dependent hydrolase
MLNGMKIVDADAHHMEPDDLWVKHIDPRFKAAAPVMGVSPSGKRTLMIEGEPAVREAGRYKSSSAEVGKKISAIMGSTFKRLAAANFSAEARLMDMDEAGVDAQIIFPSRGGQVVGREYRDTALLDACCRAYNDWSAEYCQAAPGRLRWAAMVPMQDIELAVKEAQRAAHNGAVTIYLRPNPVAGRNLFDSEYDPLWEAITKAALPVSIHDAGSPLLPSYGDRMHNHTLGHILAHPFEAMSAMAGLIFSGVVERFPTLTVVHVEADAGWTPYWVQRMEQQWSYSGAAEAPEMKMSPTEYFKRNFYVACRSDERTLPAAVELLGDENFVWNTDYPHPDGAWETGLQDIERQPISPESKRKIMWDNAARAYHLD